MSKKKIVILFIIIVVCMINVLVIRYEPDISDENIQINIEMKTDDLKEIQYYYSYNIQEPYEYTEEQSKEYAIVNELNADAICDIQAKTVSLRMDFGSKSATIDILGATILVNGKSYSIAMQELQNVVLSNDVIITIEKNSLHVEAKAGDPYIVWNLKTWNLDDCVRNAIKPWVIVGKVITCFIVDLILILAIRQRDALWIVPSSLCYNRKVTWQLSLNDFKTKYAGSYLGIFWAFVNPLVTTAVYWFVFQVGLKSGGELDYPFVLWLMAGLVPWFFFQDALNGGTNALLEYNYLVKKVVFDIDILPIVKIVSAFFIHLFFTVFILILCACYGYFPTVYTLQIIYLMICNFVLSLGLVYLTSSIVGFFRDLSQIVNIVLQVGIWVTPIMWNATQYLEPKMQLIMRLNPMYYIVEGYRDALLAKEWIIGNGTWTLYFWLVTVAIWMLGVIVFKKLKVHFADVL